LKVNNERILIVTAGTGQLDNRKTKGTFGNQPRMLPVEEVLEPTSQPVQVFL
jgi:prolyl-tRNA editing enzyme YbaK/EbsC (Cys-tRNA(Pro) deacylase)